MSKDPKAEYVFFFFFKYLMSIDACVLIFFQISLP